MNTKKISLYGLGLMAAFAFAACDNIEESLSQPVSNPQEPVFDSATVTYTAENAINVSNPAEGELKVGTFTVEGLPAGYVMGGVLELSPMADFAKTISVPLKSNEDALYADASEIAEAYSSTFTKNPAKVDLYGRVKLTAADGTEVVRIGGADKFYGDGTYEFTPAYVAPIADSYYIVTGDGSTWNFAGGVKLNHGDKNQYDDPMFTTMIASVPADANKWVVLSGEAYTAASAAGSLAGVEYYLPIYDRTDKGSEIGSLESSATTAVDLAMIPALPAPCELTLDMMSLTYTSRAAITTYYATGNGWMDWGAHWMPLSTTNFTEYRGFLNIDSEFKFAPQAGWDNSIGTSLDADAAEKDGIYTYTGICNNEKRDDGNDNIKIGTPGLYFATFNVETLSYKLQQTKTWGLVGDFNNWGNESEGKIIPDVELTPSEDLYKWTGELTVTDGQYWKFRANSSWDINLGGSENELWNNGGNITLPAGTYTVTLDLSTYPSTFTATKK